MNTWELEQAHRIGREVQRLRKECKQTAQQLADRTAQLGVKMTRQAISDLENGRRRYVTTAELTVLAAALRTSPVALVYPAPYGDSVEVLPGGVTSGFAAAQWFSALEHLPADVFDADPSVSVVEEWDMWDSASAAIHAFRELARMEELRAWSDRRAESDEDRMHVAYLDRQIEGLRAELGIDPDG